MRSNVSIDFHPYTDRGRRDYQEDYFYTDPPMRPGAPWLGVVSDGMGGHQSGDLASKAGVHALKRAFDAFVARRIRTEEALVQATAEGHKAVLKAAADANAVGNMGATVVAFVVDGSTLYWCSAGDSRLYLYRDERLVQLSRDFTLAEDMRRGVANGDWTAEDIESSPQKNALTSFMGTDSWRHHASSQELQHGDVIIACSDGVYGTIDSDGIVAACRSAGGTPSAQEIVENLQRRVLEVGKSNQDNSTAIVVRFVAPLRSSIAEVHAAVPSGEKSRLPLYGGIAAGLLGVSVLATYWYFRPTPPEPGPAVHTPAPADAPAPSPSAAPGSNAGPASANAPSAPMLAPEPPVGVMPTTPTGDKPTVPSSAYFAQKLETHWSERARGTNIPDSDAKGKQLTDAHALLEAVEAARAVTAKDSKATQKERTAVLKQLNSVLKSPPAFSKLDPSDRGAAQDAVKEAEKLAKALEGPPKKKIEDPRQAPDQPRNQPVERPGASPDTATPSTATGPARSGPQPAATPTLPAPAPTPPAQTPSPAPAGPPVPTGESAPPPKS